MTRPEPLPPATMAAVLDDDSESFTLDDIPRDRTTADRLTRLVADLRELLEPAAEAVLADLDHPAPATVAALAFDRIAP